MDQEQAVIPRCAECAVKNRICRSEDGEGPQFCPTINSTEVVKASLVEYEDPNVREFALMASIQEGECYVNRERENPHVRYAIKPRVQETIEFAHKMGYQRLGIAFCGGLHHEAKILSAILRAQGFEVASVMCKAGRTPKEFLGVADAQQISPGAPESMCNPINQAKLLNAAKTDFNILFGLCVGHDSLMLKFSDAFCTVLVAKDRVTGHNPLAAINLSHSYYMKLKKEAFKKGGSIEVDVAEFE